MRVGAFISTIALLSACDAPSPAPKSDPAPPSTPVGQIADYGCEVTGDYVESDVLSAVTAEAIAWQACAHQVVTAEDAKTGTRVQWGTFSFRWDLIEGKPGNVALHTDGDGQACLAPILDRLESTAAFSGKTAGTLSCSVSFDDSLPR